MGTGHKASADKEADYRFTENNGDGMESRPTSLAQGAKRQARRQQQRQALGGSGRIRVNHSSKF